MVHSFWRRPRYRWPLFLKLYHSQGKQMMAMEKMNSLKSMKLFDKTTRLAETNAVLWFLGFGFGGATGLALAYAFFAIWSDSPIWIAMTATLVAAVHASIIFAFWFIREVVLQRTALMVSMIASAILTCSLAWIIGVLVLVIDRFSCMSVLPSLTRLDLLSSIRSQTRIEPVHQIRGNGTITDIAIEYLNFLSD